MKVRVPVGTQKGTIVGINGIPYVICQTDTGLCGEVAPRPLTYYDAQGAVTEDICEAVSVDLNAGTSCCGDTFTTAVPVALAGTPAGTPLFTEEYPNDGTAIPDLALTGSILVAYVAEDEDCVGSGYWDSVQPAPPDGYVWLEVGLISPGVAISAALSAACDCPEPATIDLIADAATTLEFSMATAGSNVTVDWGDGTVESVPDGVPISHAYTSPYTGRVTFSLSDNDSVTTLRGMTGLWAFDLDDLNQFSNLQDVQILDDNITFGDIANLPSGLTDYDNRGNNTTSGDIAYLPVGLTEYVNRGDNTTSGDIANLPVGLTYYNNQGFNTTSGDIANLPSGLTDYDNRGNNTTSGDIANLPVGLTYYYNAGDNTTSGDIANLPVGLTYYYNTGFNTTSGDIANLLSGLTYYDNRGSNTVTAVAAPAFSADMRYFVSTVTLWTSPQIDALLIAMAATTWISEKFINVAGTNSARTAASDAAVTTLTGLGVTVTTN